VGKPRGNCGGLVGKRILRGVELDHKHGAFLSLGGLQREPSAAGEGATEKDQGAIGVAHVPFGANGVRAGGGRPERINVGNGTVLSPAFAWAPAANRKVVPEPRIECSAINAGLATGDNGEWREREQGFDGSRSGGWTIQLRRLLGMKKGQVADSRREPCERLKSAVTGRAR